MMGKCGRRKSRTTSPRLIAHLPQPQYPPDRLPPLGSSLKNAINDLQFNCSSGSTCACAVGNRLEKWLNTDPQFDANRIPTDTIADELVASLYDANDRLLETRDYTAPDPPDPEAPDWTAQNGTHVQTTTYAYAQTQQTAKVVKDANDQTTSKLLFDYDLQGRLWKATTETYADGDLSSRERVTYDYDATGIRVSALQETDPNLDGQYQPVSRTEFLVDHHNFTGYQQVLKETSYDADGEITKTIEYTIGLDEIAQTVTPYVEGAADPENAQTHIFAHDGHGSVRVLFDLSAAIAQLYAFDAYGQLLGIHTGAAQFVSALPADALTTLLYSGEHFDAKLAMQYLRARYYDPATGRFNRLDPFFGKPNDPQSLHKYLYAHADPINGVDPTGRDMIGALGALTIGAAIGGLVGGALYSVLGGNFVDGFVVGALTMTGLMLGGGLAVTLALLAYAQAAAILIHSRAFQRVEPLPLGQVQGDFEYALLAQAAYRNADQTERTNRGWSEEGVYLHDEQRGYRAVLYRKGGQLVMAYAGTDDHVPPWDWTANFGQALFGGTRQYEFAETDAAEVIASHPGAHIHFVGHSLGGGLASAAALEHNLRATTFNASGLNARTADLSSANQLIRAYRVQGELLSAGQDSILLGWALPNGVGQPFYLPGSSSNAFSRHLMDDVIEGMRLMGAH